MDIKNEITNRSSRPDLFCKKGGPIHFRPRPATLLKKRLWDRCFPVNYTKFLRLFEVKIKGN